MFVFLLGCPIQADVMRGVVLHHLFNSVWCLDVLCAVRCELGTSHKAGLCLLYALRHER